MPSMNSIKDDLRSILRNLDDAIDELEECGYGDGERERLEGEKQRLEIINHALQQENYKLNEKMNKILQRGSKETLQSLRREKGYKDLELKFSNLGEQRATEKRAAQARITGLQGELELMNRLIENEKKRGDQLEEQVKTFKLLAVDKIEKGKL